MRNKKLTIRSAKKGFTLFEALVASLILTILGTGMIGIYIVEHALLLRTSHRVQAIDYARSAAELLTYAGDRAALTGWWQEMPELTLGEHSESTDGEICILPNSYFKTQLRGKLYYSVDSIQVGNPPIPARLAEITVEWEERFPKRERLKEKLYIATEYWF